ncbi:MAG: SRPBCC family protein [Mycobacteriales bacterium]
MTMAKELARDCRVEVEVAAPVDAVWRVVADVTRTGEWSHECHRVELLHGATSAVRGTQLHGGNKSLWWRWSRTSEIIELEPGRLISWRTIPTWRFVDSTEWRITLQPVPIGTRIVQTYQVVRCPRWWEWLAVHANPPHRDRSVALAADVRRIGDVAVADIAAANPIGAPPP